MTTVFNNQRLFAESATDFYAFVRGRISRYDRDGPEYAAFKTMLLTYVDLISADVARHAPAVAALPEQIEDRLDLVLATLDSPRSHRHRRPNRTVTGPHPRRLGGADRLAHREAGPVRADAAACSRRAGLGQLIANAKRMLAAAGTGVSRRADLLRLAV